jgi:putative tryptophan/tyrosine transport system substrate-binding protein
MRRRDFSAILLIAGAAMQPVLAQAPVKQRRIAIVAAAGKPENISETGSGFWRTFFGELRRLGHVEGGDLVVERYSAEGHPGRYGDLAQDVVSLNPDVILVTGNQLARAFRPWTGATPIVATMADPLATGMVESLARPGGYLTGVSSDAGIEIWGKRLQLLKEAVPSVTRLAYVGVQLARIGATRQAIESAAQRLGLSIVGVSGRRAQSRGISSPVCCSRRTDAGCNRRYLRVWRWNCSTRSATTAARHLPQPLLYRSWWTVSLWVRCHRNCPTDCQ